MKYTADELRQYLEWDIHTWKKALQFWQENYPFTNTTSSACGIELGGRNGGVSLFFSKELNSKMICSDLNPPNKTALNTQRHQGLQTTFEQADMLNLHFPDNSFDFAVFKSVLGSLPGKEVNTQKKAIQEIHRVLKPGGYLYFAENLRSTVLHQFARQHLVPWGKNWRYVTVDELDCMFSLFSEINIMTCGLFSAFIKDHWNNSKRVTAYIDHVIEKATPASWHYVAYGYARK